MCVFFHEAVMDGWRWEEFWIRLEWEGEDGRGGWGGDLYELSNAHVLVLQCLSWPLDVTQAA